MPKKGKAAQGLAEDEDPTGHHAHMDLESLESMVPKCLYWQGENSCCSGILEEIPCFDCYGPTMRCCGPVPLCYCAKEMDFYEFFEEVLPTLHTGDIILTAWPLQDPSYEEIRLAKWAMHSKYSHVGVVYRPSDCPEVLTLRAEENPGDPSRPLIAQMLSDDDESHPSCFYMLDAEIMLKDYIDKFSSEDGEELGEFDVACRRLLNVERDLDFYRTVHNTILAHRNCRYKCSHLSGISLCRCILHLHEDEDPDEIMCSQFVAKVYQALDLINPALDPAQFVPPHFDTTRHLWLRHGARLSEMYALSGPDSLEERDYMGYPPINPNQDKNFWNVNPRQPIADVWEDGEGPIAGAGPAHGHSGQGYARLPAGRPGGARQLGAPQQDQM